MKKLLIFHSALAPYRLDFFNKLAENFDCTVVFLSRNNRNQNFDQGVLLSQAKFKYSYLDKKIVIKGRDLNLGYWRQLKKYQPDIVIGGEYGLPVIMPYIFKFFSKKKFKLLTICDDSLDIATNCLGIRKFMRDLLVPRLDNIIVLSELVASWYQENYSLKKSPIIFSLIRDEKKYREKLSGVLGISNRYISQFDLTNKNVFLFVGRLDKVKNVEVLLKAFDKVAGKEERLIIVGEGPQYSHLMNILSKLKNKSNIIFTGRYEDDELIAWYNVADVLVLPSTYEPFGAVVNEGLAAGCFVLCSEFAGAASLINDKNGIVFNPNKVGDLEGSIVTILDKIISKDNNRLKAIKSNLMQVSFEELMLPLKNNLNFS
jgi:glycosyltransferase involved in cell wall biosynthesis